MNSFSVVRFLIVVTLIEYCVGSDYTSLFTHCDKNADNSLSFEELTLCLPDEDNHARKLEPAAIIKHMDMDQSGDISLKEYMAAVNNVKDRKDEPIEVIDRQGNKKIYTSDQLFDKIAKSPQNLKKDGDMIVKENEGKSTIDSIQTDNPQMANIITMAKWSVAQMVLNGVIANGTSIVNLRTLSVDEDSRLPKVLLSPTKIYKANLQLELAVVNNGKKSKQWTVEIEVLRDVDKYLRPHLNLENVWKCNSKGERVELLPSFITGEQRYWSTMIFRAVNTIQLYINVQMKKLIGFVWPEEKVLNNDL